MTRPRDPHSSTPKRVPAVRALDPQDLRIALFSGNYNYTADGVNRVLNRLVRYLEARGVGVLVVSPTVEKPAFDPAGTLLSAPSLPVPGRSEYRISLGLPGAVRDRLAAFCPHLFHLSAPDRLCLRAQKQAQKWNLPVLASFHTRFDTYLDHYGLGFLRGAWQRYAKGFYGACDRVLAPSQSMAETLEAEGIARQVGLWSRGVDCGLFDPARRSLEWRRAHGIGDDEIVVTFAGRLVREKGLGAFADTLDQLREMGLPHRAMVIGDGPERETIRRRLPDAVHCGFLTGEALGQAYAASDIFFNPSRTETFGNVTLEAMASGLPTLCADATGSRNLVDHGVTGFLVKEDGWAYVERLAQMLRDPALRYRMGAAARQKALGYDWDSILGGLLKVYCELAAPRDAATFAIPLTPEAA